MRPAVFLDRDGVIIEDRGYISRASDVRLIAGAVEALKSIDPRYLKVVVTNQSGIGRGLYTEAQYHEVDRRLNRLLKAESITLDGVYHCPHSPEAGCSCRKPEPGMLIQARKDLGIDLGASWMIGDKPSDIEAGKRCGCRTILLESRYWESIGETGPSPDFILSDLAAAVKIVNDQPLNADP